MRGILLALVVVLFAGKAEAADYLFSWGQQYFGIADFALDEYESIDASGKANNLVRSSEVTVVHFGPIGYRKVPFSATQGLVGFCLILFTLFALLIVFSVRWRRREKGEATIS